MVHCLPNGAKITMIRSSVTIEKITFLCSSQQVRGAHPFIAEILLVRFASFSRSPFHVGAQSVAGYWKSPEE